MPSRNKSEKICELASRSLNKTGCEELWKLSDILLRLTHMSRAHDRFRKQIPGLRDRASTRLLRASCDREHRAPKAARPDRSGETLRHSCRIRLRRELRVLPQLAQNGTKKEPPSPAAQR